MLGTAEWAGKPPARALTVWRERLATNKAFNEPIAQSRAAENTGLLSRPFHPPGPPRPGQAGQALPGSPGLSSQTPLPLRRVQVARGSSLLFLPLAGRLGEALERKGLPGAGLMLGDSFA